MTDETTEILEKLGAVKSNYSLIKMATNQIKKRLLLEEESANDSPASFMNIFLENFGRIGARSFYEQMMYKNELNPSTAISLRSLMNKLNSNMISEIFARPAEMTFVLGYEYEELIELAKQNNNKLVLNKETKFSISGYEEFTLDHNINIIVSNPGEANQNMYAIFDTSDKLNPNSLLTNVNNIFISTQVYRYENKNIFGMFIPTRQMSRNEKIVNITDTITDFSNTYEDQLFGFEIHYMGLKESKYRFLKGEPDGIVVPSGYNYSIDLDEKKININFNKNVDLFHPIPGDKIKLIIYTTKGSSGNFKMVDIYNQYENIKFVYGQDKTNVNQDVITSLKPYVSIRDGIAENGRNMKNFEEIRSIVINRGSGSTILTPGDLEKISKERGFTVEKIRNDIRCLEYRALGILESGSDIISSIKANLYFDFTDIPVNKEVNNRTISPKSIFEKNLSTGRCEYVKNPETYVDYYNKYRLDEKNQFMFPYHIRFVADNELRADIFNMNIDNENYILDFVYFNNNTANETSIINISLNRDPINEDVSLLPGGTIGNPNTTGYYQFSFVVSTSSNVVESLSEEQDEPINKFRILIKDRESGSTYATDCYVTGVDIDNNLLYMSAYLKTNDAITTNTNKMCFRDYTVYPVPIISEPIEYYFIGSNIDIQLYCIEKNLDNKVISTIYDDILFRGEKDALYFVSTVYKAQDINLFTNYNDNIELTSDIMINQADFEYYENDIYDIYETDIYETDSNGKIITEDITIEVDGISTTVPRLKTIHKKGDIIYNSDGTAKIKYRKGTAKMDSMENNTFIKREKYIGIIKNAPVYDRIHSIGVGFNYTLLAYEKLISNIKSLNNMAPDGVKISMGIKNTSGAGDYEIYNMITSRWEPIDNIALSFDIGVKYYKSANNDTSIDNEIISNKIRDFINGFEEISFSINNIFDMIKESLPSVEYLILYKINQYPANKVQVIRKKDNISFVNEKMSLRQIIDAGKTNISSKEVVFKSDITIRVIE